MGARNLVHAAADLLLRRWSVPGHDPPVALKLIYLTRTISPAWWDVVQVHADVRVIRTPVQTRWANALAERFIGTPRRECSTIS